MTNYYLNQDDIAKLRAIALGASQGQWAYGATHCPDTKTAVDLVKANLEATKSPVDYFYEVFLAEDGRRTAMVGNGPTSEQNSKYIATFNPAMVLRLLDNLDNMINLTKLKQ